MSGRDGNRVVEGYGYQPLPPNAIEGHVIKDIDALSQTVQKIIGRNHLKSKFVVLSVPDSLVINKVVQVNEGLNKAEIEELVIIEADKFIPFPIEEINIDFEILGPSAKNTAMLDVLVVASRSENIATRVEAVTKAGLQVKVMDVESFAIERAYHLVRDQLPIQSENKITAVIDIGAIYANLFVLKNNDVIFTREEEFGGNQLVDTIEHHYHIPRQDALTLGKQQQLPQDYQEAIVNPFVETLLVHVKRALQFFYSTANDSVVDQIILTGGIAKLPKLDQIVKESIKIPTFTVNPFSHLKLSRKINQERMIDDAPLLMIACGLALRGMGKVL